MKNRAKRNIAWIEKYCKVPEGRDVGKQIKLLKFQREILKGIYDSPTRTAIISFGRKNGKTSLAAMLLLLHLCGPEAKANSQLFSTAQSRDQAAILFALASKIIKLSNDLSSYVIVRDTRKELFCSEIGTKYTALSADHNTAHGLSPAFVVHDELGRVRGPKYELYDALETATAAQEDPLSIIISTQATTDNDLLSLLIDDAKKKSDKKVKLFLYTTNEQDDPFSVESIKKANPAFNKFQNKTEILAQAKTAQRMPTAESSYRNLILNQRVVQLDPFITKTIWENNGGEVIQNWEGRDIYCGLDLSSTTDLTAFVMVTKVDGQIHVKPTFWLPKDTLLERSRQDHQPYDVWATQGYIQTTPGKSIQYEFVANYISELCHRLNIKKIRFDSWSMPYFKPWILKAGMPESTFSELFEEFRQGYRSMSPAVRELESYLLDGKINHGRHPVLTMCASQTVVTMDAKENRILDKEKSYGRIDGMVALAMAVSNLQNIGDAPQFVVGKLVLV